MHQPGFYACGPGDCGAVVPGERGAGYEVGEGGGEEEEAAEDAEDVEKSEAVGTVVWV